MWVWISLTANGSDDLHKRVPLELYLHSTVTINHCVYICRYEEMEKHGVRKYAIKSEYVTCNLLNKRT